MIRIFSPGEQGALCTEDCDLETLPAGAVWIDMLTPTAEEEAFVERELGVSVPTRDEMVEIEPSSRMYQENDAIYATVNVVAGFGTDEMSSTAVSFVLTPAHLVTVRYGTPKVFEVIRTNFERNGDLTNDPAETLVQLLDAIIDRLADALEHIGTEMDRISSATFRRAAPAGTRRARVTTVALQALLARIGHAQDVVSRARDSALTIARALGYLSFALPRTGPRERLKSLSRDVSALTDHAAFLGNNVVFLLDAVLGLINLEQANVGKVFSIAALVFLPPTLVAGIYGMNFEILPELKWHFGYVWALGLMLVSMVVPYLLFKWRGWL